MSSAAIDKAVKARWLARGLEARFRAFWSDPTKVGFAAWNDSEARANTPMPYCVFEKLSGIKQQTTTGKDSEPMDTIEHWVTPVQFTIVAATPISGSHLGRTGKDIAAELLGQGSPDPQGLLGAFEDAAGRMEMENHECHVQTIVGPDFCVRLDDDVWQWVQQMDIWTTRRRRLLQPA